MHFIIMHMSTRTHYDPHKRDLAIFTSQERVRAMCVKFILSCLLEMGGHARTTIGGDGRRRRRVLDAS